MTKEENKLFMGNLFWGSSLQLQDPKEKWKETSACVNFEQVWDSGMSIEQGAKWKFPLCHIFDIFLMIFFPHWLHLQKQSVPSWWRRVWQQLKQATFLLEKSNYPTLLTPTLKWHFLWKHLKYKSKATIKHKNKLARFFVPYLFSELFFACFPQLWHKCCYFSPTRHFLVLNQNNTKSSIGQLEQIRTYALYKISRRHHPQTTTIYWNTDLFGQTS